MKTELSVFTFGMAHKVRGEYYRKLDELLKRTGKSYSLYLSTALHEGMSIETAFDAAVKNIRDAFSARSISLASCPMPRSSIICRPPLISRRSFRMACGPTIQASIPR